MRARRFSALVIQIGEMYLLTSAPFETFSSYTKNVILDFKHFFSLFRNSGDTSYMSQAPQAVLVEKKICLVEKFFHMIDCHVEKFHHMTNCQLEKCLHIANKEKNYVLWRNVEQNVSCGDISPHEKCGNKYFRHYLCCFFFFAKSALLPFTLYCREIYFVPVYALLCGENLLSKCVCGEKKTNMR